MRVTLSAFIGLFACLSAGAVAAEISGKIYRVSHEPTGIYFSIQDDAGEALSFDPENCGIPTVLVLPSDHVNYQVLSAVVYSHHQNNKSISATVSGCRFNVPAVSGIAKVFEN